MSDISDRKPIPVLKVRQWLADWDNIKWDPGENRAEPQHWFYQFSMSATELKMLSGVYRRTTYRTKTSEDLGIQRGLEQRRSNEIRKFVKFGHPWSDLSKEKRNSDDFQDLRQPGWLPTAIVVNILMPGNQRSGKQVSEPDLVKIEDNDNSTANLLLPKDFGKDWKYEAIPPLEVIDGQHRLWAFEDKDEDEDDTVLKGDYELPVVAFVGLDLSWQAYLFYTINIKPKKINPSLAFDLYPLLRTEEWLTKFEGHVIYRETRAQELVDLLWSYPESPWYHRINMLGERGHQGLMVTQAAWIRSLLVSFVKRWEGSNTKIGGLFGTLIGENNTVLPWNRTDQVAFLIVMGKTIQGAIKKTNEPWAKALREEPSQQDEDSAFFGRNNLLNQDQGIRILMQVVNDLCFIEEDSLKLHEWRGHHSKEGNDQEQIKASVDSLYETQEILDYLKQLSESLASYDWRASSAPGLTEEERTLKASFRGTGGYKELRRNVLRHISRGGGTPAQAAEKILGILGY